MNKVSFSIILHKSGKKGFFYDYPYYYCCCCDDGDCCNWFGHCFICRVVEKVAVCNRPTDRPMTNNLHGGYHDLDSTLSITAFASLDAFWRQNVSPTSSSASCYCAAYNVFILEGDLWLTQIMANTFFSLYWFFLHYFATLPAVW